MKPLEATRTAEHMAFFRALESARSAPTRLFEDRFAIHFLQRAVRFSRIPIVCRFITAYLQAVKLIELRRLLPELPERIRFVPMDFDGQSISGVLGASGFDPLLPTAFVWEGVTNYLSSAGVDSILRYVAGSAAGSVLIFTYVHRGALDGSGRFADAAELLIKLQRLGEPWTFGLDPDGGIRIESRSHLQLFHQQTGNH
jgi:O-methyltransferase involved in polyketide biosynthesis